MMSIPMLTDILDTVNVGWKTTYYRNVASNLLPFLFWFLQNTSINWQNHRKQHWVDDVFPSLWTLETFQDGWERPSHCRKTNYKSCIQPLIWCWLVKNLQAMPYSSKCNEWMVFIQHGEQASVVAKQSAYGTSLTKKTFPPGSIAENDQGINHTDNQL